MKTLIATLMIANTADQNAPMTQVVNWNQPPISAADSAQTAFYISGPDGTITVQRHDLQVPDTIDFNFPAISAKDSAQFAWHLNTWPTTASRIISSGMLTVQSGRAYERILNEYREKLTKLVNKLNIHRENMDKKAAAAREQGLSSQVIYDILRIYKQVHMSELIKEMETVLAARENFINTMFIKNLRHGYTQQPDRPIRTR